MGFIKLLGLIVPLALGSVGEANKNSYPWYLSFWQDTAGNWEGGSYDYPGEFFYGYSEFNDGSGNQSDLVVCYSAGVGAYVSDSSHDLLYYDALNFPSGDFKREYKINSAVPRTYYTDYYMETIAGADFTGLTYPSRYSFEFLFVPKNKDLDFYVDGNFVDNAAYTPYFFPMGFEGSQFYSVRPNSWFLPVEYLTVANIDANGGVEVPAGNFLLFTCRGNAQAGDLNYTISEFTVTWESGSLLPVPEDWGITYFFELMGMLWVSMFAILSIPIFPGLSLGVLILFPVALGIFNVVMKAVSG